MKRYRLTEEQYEKLLVASQPTPMIMLQCGSPDTRQDRANAAWTELGREIGFQAMTVRPAGTDPRDFTAEPVATLPS